WFRFSERAPPRVALTESLVPLFGTGSSRWSAVVRGGPRWAVHVGRGIAVRLRRGSLRRRRQADRQWRRTRLRRTGRRDAARARARQRLRSSNLARAAADVGGLASNDRVQPTVRAPESRHRRGR